MSKKINGKSIAGILFALALLAFVYCVFYENISIMTTVVIGAILCLCYAGLEFYQKDDKLELKATKIAELKEKIKTQKREVEELKSFLEAANNSKKIYEQRYNEMAEYTKKLETLVIEQKKKLDYIERTFKQ